MIETYRFMEITIYSLLNLLPFLFLAVYPFKDKMRFKKSVTISMIILLSLIQISIGTTVAFFSNGHQGTISILNTMIYAIFYFSMVKAHFGKTLFTLLLLSNAADFVVESSKCFEGIFFPQMAMQQYRWTFSLMMFIVEVIFLTPMFFYMKNIVTPAMQKFETGFEWNYLWLIPATFYVTWFYNVYNKGKMTTLELALNPMNSFFYF